MLQSITFDQIGFIPTRIDISGSGTNPGYSTEGQTHATSSVELNTVNYGAFNFIEPLQSSFGYTRYFRINLDTNTPYPGYQNPDLPSYNGGFAYIKWPGPHMVCEIEATIVVQDYDGVNYGNENTQTACFRHTLVRDSLDPSLQETFNWDFEILSNPGSQFSLSSPILSSTSNEDNYVEYNSALNTFDFYVQVIYSDSAQSPEVNVQGTYLLI